MMPQSERETHLTRTYWKRLGQGTLYEEFRVVDKRPGQEVRRVDGLVDLGGQHRIASKGERPPTLNDQDIIIIQTKATPLNPYVFGQALLSPQLVRLSWAPSSVRSVLLCTADDPKLREVVRAYPEIEVCIESDEVVRFSPRPLPGAAERVRRLYGGALKAPAGLSASLTIAGILVPGETNGFAQSLAQLVSEKHLISIHGHQERGRAATLGMYLSGEVIVGQALLKRMGAASVRSIVVCRRGDRAVEAALCHYTKVEIDMIGDGTPARAR